MPYQERGMRTLVFTAEIDDRHARGQIHSRIGLSSPVAVFATGTDLYAAVATALGHQAVHCVLVDECHFLSREQVAWLCAVVDELDIPVLCYGLRTDFRAEPFAGSLWLLAWADKLVELKTVCYCGRKANRVLRVDEQGKAVHERQQVVIGGNDRNDRYVSVCRKHFTEALTRAAPVPGMKTLPPA